jgi:hypothetical protein
MEATPGIEIHANYLSGSRLASKSCFVTQVQRSESRLSPDFPLSVHGVVPNPYQIQLLKSQHFHGCMY